MPDFKMLLHCGSCKQWVPTGRRWPEGQALEDHKTSSGKSRCRNSGMSGDGWKYAVATKKEARLIAELMQKDTGECLKPVPGIIPRGMHSNACGGGTLCSEERAARGRALADWFLSQQAT